MSFHPLRRFLRKSFVASPEAPSASTHFAAETSWDDLVRLNRSSDADSSTFDDLASVPFAGAAPDPIHGSAPESSSVPEVSGETPSAIDPENAIGGGSLSEQRELSSSPELEAFKDFFKLDLRIKSELIRLAPSPADSFDAASQTDYADRAYKSFRDFRHDFSRLNSDFRFGKSVATCLDGYFAREAKHFEISHYGSDTAQKLYRSVFSDMRPAFVEAVKDKCVGYIVSRGDVLESLIDQSSSINELLHAYHSYIMNNEDLLQAIPPLAEKKNQYGYPIVLRGDDSAPARQVFDALPDDLDVGYTDIIAADDHLMMMVRNRGHALTINSSPDPGHPGELLVEYDIPKICNENMIKTLPGLTGYSENGARGVFSVPQSEIGPRLVDFIAKVPMDSDMWKPGGPLYYLAPKRPSAKPPRQN